MKPSRPRAAWMAACVMVIIIVVAGGFNCRSSRQQLHTPSGRRQAGQQLVVEQQDSQQQHQVIQECVIAGEDDAYLKWRDNHEAGDLPAPWEEQHEDQYELGYQSQKCGLGVEPMGKVLYVPA